MAGRITSETDIAASRSLCNFAAYKNPNSLLFRICRLSRTSLPLKTHFKKNETITMKRQQKGR
jgi:hypothetical protein